MGLLFLTGIQLVFLLLSQTTKNLVIISGTVFFITCVLVLIAFLRARGIRKKSAGLSEVYRKAYLEAEEIIEASILRRGQKKAVSEMVLEIFACADRDGRKPEDVYGGEVSGLVNGFIEEIGIQKSAFALLIQSAGFFLGFLLVIEGYKLIKIGSLGTEAFQSASLDVGIVLLYALVSFLFIPFLRITLQAAFSRRWKGLKWGLLLIPTLVPLGLVALLIKIEDQAVRFILDAPLHLFRGVPSMVTAAAAALLFLLLPVIIQNR